MSLEKEPIPKKWVRIEFVFRKVDALGPIDPRNMYVTKSFANVCQTSKFLVSLGREANKSFLLRKNYYNLLKPDISEVFLGVIIQDPAHPAIVERK